MKRIASILLILPVLFACTSMGVYDGDRRILGVVERTGHSSRAGEPSPILMGFGAIGGLLYGEMKKPTSTNLYVVKTDDGERVTAQVDGDFAVGDCVEIIPTKSATTSRGYAYGDARIVRSTRCVADLAPTPAKTADRE